MSNKKLTLKAHWWSSMWSFFGVYTIQYNQYTFLYTRVPISYQSEIQPEFTPPVSAFCLFSERCAFSFACFHFFQTPWLSRASSSVTKPNRDKQQLADHGSRPPNKQMHIILQGTSSNAVVLWVRNPDSCSYSGLVSAFSGWYFRLLIVSRHCVKRWGGTCRNLSRSVLEMWYVFVDSFCFRCQKQKKVLLQFSSGSVEARIVYLARVSTCPCSGVLLNSVYLYRVSLEACWGKQAQDERSVEEDEVDE